MYKGQKILALIPARGGSKGLPGKNIRPLCGKPLLAWTIVAAKQSKFLDRVVLSTDDEGIAAVAKQYGCEVPFMRPFQLATDNATSAEVAKHALEQLPGFDYLMLLQPTSPLRTVDDIDTFICEALDGKFSSYVSVVKSAKHPAWMFQLQDKKLEASDAKYSNLSRQELPPVYTLNGALYLAKVDWFLKNMHFVDKETGAYIMPEDRSVDIDTAADWALAEFYARGGK